MVFLSALNLFGSILCPSTRLCTNRIEADAFAVLIFCLPARLLHRCTLQKIQFLKFEVAPVLDLRVTPTREGCMVEMLDCRVSSAQSDLEAHD